MRTEKQAAEPAVGVPQSNAKELDNRLDRAYDATMRSGLNKKNILAVLLLFCFSLYAVSPLARTFHLDSSKAVRGEIERPAAKIYVIHFLLSSLLDVESSDASGEQDDESGDHCLVKKKRVLVSVKNFRSILSASMVEIAVPRTGPTEAAFYSRVNGFSAKPQTAQNTIVSLHPGNAPPVS